jgi:hypothetical protein
VYRQSVIAQHLLTAYIKLIDGWRAAALRELPLLFWPIDVTAVVVQMP